METSQYTTQVLDHQGIVAGMCNRIGLIERVDSIVGNNEREVTVGEAVQAMVLNGLGFVGRPLYLIPEYFHNKPVDMLIREGLSAEDLNQYSLGRALDRLYEAGVTEVFAAIAAQAVQMEGIATDFVHLDSTSFALHGQYAPAENEELGVISITHGYSRDHRPDLKQVVLSLICSHQAAIPTWLKVLSGNAADAASFPEIVKAYVQQLKADEQAPCFVADSALYSAGTLQEMGEAVKWVTRVPASIELVKELFQTVELADMQPMLAGDYRVLPLCSLYGGVRQRWLLVYSEAIYQRAERQFHKRLTKERQEAEKGLRRLSRRQYPSPAAAQVAVETLFEQWKFHTAAVSFEPVAHYNQPGRPAQGQSPDHYTWQPVGQVIEIQQAVTAELAKKGKFVLATNQLDEQQIPTQALIALYKGQNATVERGFRFLKDPLFFAHSLFLKKPARIMALLMVMGLCLLIYALAEHRLRAELARREETVPDQKGQPTQRITMRRVFQVFEGIHVLCVHHSHGVQRFTLNLTDLHLKILRILGPPFEKCYSVSH